MIKVLVFDFDGTLVNSYPAWLKSNEDIFRNFKIKHPKKTAIDLMKSGKQGSKYLLEDLKLDKKIVKEISKQVNKAVVLKIKKIRANLGFKNIGKIKLKKFVLSNSCYVVINSFLNKNKINFFEKIYGGDKFKDKVDVLKKIKKKYKLRKNEIIYFGDIAKDSLKAKKAGVLSCIILKHAWDTKKEILESKPDFIIQDLRYVEKLIKNS